MKKKSIRFLSWLLTLIVFFMSINLSFISKAEGNGPSVYINPSNTQAIYTYDGYYVVFNLNGSWNGGHNVGIQIYNTSSELIEDWTLESDYSNNISNIWNASVIENANGQTRIYHDTWNSIIYPNSCVEFGFSSNETFASFPSYFGILGSEIIETNSELFSIDYNVTDEWGDGYTGLVTITNNSENVIRNWALDFSCNNENISVWNAELISKEGNRVSVGNMGFNADINPGESVTFGFIVYNKTNNDEFYDYSLSESVFVTNEPQRELEPLGDIGEAYCKEVRDEDVVFDEETWLCYAKNQLLISAYLGTPRELVEEIVSEVGATIVGYIEFTCDYQIEFAENKSLEELQMIADYIEGYSFISKVTLNLAVEEYTSAIPNLYNDNKTFVMKEDTFEDETYNYSVVTISDDIEKWNQDVPKGDKWNLETIHAQSAWNLIPNPYTIKVGVIDSYFERNRDYNDLIFDEIINQDETRQMTIKEKKHGTHVAGIIGAANDGAGITGVSPGVHLYGFSYLKSSNYIGMMDRKIGFAKLIINHVRIINVSLGYGDKTRSIIASYENMDGCEESRNSIKEEADLIAEFLDKLVQAGYDFLIVNSAGNYNCKYYTKEENNNKIKFIECEEGETSDLFLTDIDSKYGYYINAIEENEVIKNRIIVVGSMNYSRAYSSFSNVGSRVNVCAPGENILSTVPYGITYPGHSEAYSGYELLSGTSQAAPHISGIAALMLQANPQLNSEQLKSIICDYSNSTQRTYTNDKIGNYSYFMPLADKCVEKALSTAPINKNTDIDWPMGMIAGSIKDSSNKSVPNAKIMARRVGSEGYYVLNSYFELNSDNEGNYIDTLPVGKYDLIFYSDKNLAVKYNGVEIIEDKVTYLNVKLCNKNSSSQIGGSVIDGITGMPIENAEIKIRKNWDSTEGKYVKKNITEELIAQSNSQGKFCLDKKLTGNYTVEIIKDGYQTGYFNVTTVRPEEGTEEETFVLSPILPDNEYRVILTWNSSPRDLDSHLTYYDDNDEKQLHVYFGHLYGYYNNKKIAQLDLDDTSGYGPETVTITLNTDCMDSGYFRYSVYNYSNELSMSQSNATIRVYHGREKAQIFYVPLEADENTWCVFELSKDGIITKNECFHTYGSSEVQ